jgi:hypothetical protein
MLGRYVINNAKMNRPRAASEKASVVFGKSFGCSKPSVSKDDPLDANASRSGRTPFAQNIAV